MKSRRENTPSSSQLPDLRDGLNRLERIVLHELRSLQRERVGARVSSFELYGRVAEQIDLSTREFQAVLQKLAGR